MIEIEAKVWLTPAEKRETEKKLSRLGPPEKSIRKDEYYEKEKAFYVRVRDSNGKASLDLKHKKIMRGMEANEELSFPLVSAKKGRALLQNLSLRRTAIKKKHSQVWHQKNASFELHHIPGLGDFLEIELLVASKKEAPAARRQLKKLFGELGFWPERFEKKYYLELLQDQRQKR